MAMVTVLRPAEKLALLKYMNKAALDQLNFTQSSAYEEYQVITLHKLGKK